VIAGSGRGSVGWAAVAAAAVLALALALAGCVGPQRPVPSSSVPTSAAPAPSAAPDRPSEPLAGRVIVLDPGHQLGNAAHPAEIGRLVEAGGFQKPCNTTGTTTDAGYAEATVNFRLARRVARDLRRLGATVRLTRATNSEADWGPCVDVRGRAGNPRPGRAGADLKVSLHADGRYGGGPGFHVISTPDDPASLRLARLLRDSLTDRDLEPATYVGERGIDLRTDLATLNLSRIPTVMLESGNLRDPEDAERLSGRRGRSAYVAGIVNCVRRYLR
jgi:N-acetylmuramoyl-L-alanine amidase